MTKFLPPVLLAVFVSSISFLKSLHCRANFFASPDSYTHLCYSDIPALFSARGLDRGINPYADPLNSMEYPVGTGYIASLIARLADDFITFFDLNALLIAMLLVIMAIVMRILAPNHWHFALLAPAVISSLYINWDIWAVVAMVFGFYYLKQERFDLAGIWMGLSIVIKFFPVVFLPAFALYFLSRSAIDGKNVKDLQKSGGPQFALYLLLTVFLLNVSTAITHFDGWFRFFTFNQDRGVDFGSIWYALVLLFEVSIDSLNFTIALFGAAVLLLLYPRLRHFFALIRQGRVDSYQLLLLSSFLSLALLFSLNKVYSPQYIIWLTPVAVLLIATSSGSAPAERAWFWIWQTGEAIYHLGIWQYLAEYSGGQGLSEPLYALTIIIRISTLVGFAVTVARARLPLPLKESVDTGSR